MPNVATIDVSFEKKSATITTAGTQPLTREQVDAALKAKGYGIVDFVEQTAPPAPR